jgi:hypothetical protein
MIDIASLTDEDLGRWVVYTDGTGAEQLGRIKRWNDTWIFVVYNCANEWDNYKDYTAAATDPSDLKFEMLKPGEDDINDRFEILDL